MKSCTNCVNWGDTESMQAICNNCSLYSHWKPDEDILSGMTESEQHKLFAEICDRMGVE